MAPPKIEHIDVYFRKSKPFYCRDSEKHNGVKLCFDVGDNVVAYQYKPETFAKAFGADLEKLNRIIAACPLCNKMEAMFSQPKDIEVPKDYFKDEIMSFAHNMVSALSHKYGVPPPEIKMAECPTGNTKTCYAFNPSNPADGVIYLHPLDIGPQAIAHEFYHYWKSKTGTPTEAANEMAAISFARKEVAEMFPLDLNNEKTILGYRVNDTMLSKIDSALSGVANFFKVPAETITDAYVPEFVGSGLEFLYNYTGTRFGSALFSALTGAGLMAASLLPQIDTRGRKFMHEIAAHMITRPVYLTYGPNFGIAQNEARAFGAALGRFDAGGAFRALFQGASGLTGAVQSAIAKAKSVVGFGGVPPMVSLPDKAISAPSAVKAPIDVGINMA